jgi:micrococcal nuclease
VHIIYVARSTLKIRFDPPNLKKECQLKFKFLLKILLVLICLLVVAVSGCVENSNSSDSNYTDSSYNQTAPENCSTSQHPAHYDASGYCYHVVDGDTIDVDGVGRIRLVGVNTPERGQPGYQNATDFVKSMCLGKTVYLDVDDAKNHDKYGRTLAVVYVGNVNLNQELLKRGYAEVMYIPPSEFPPGLYTL